ncbi:MAG: antibiotic biosynthesis monooxygenase [Hyphomicrobiales bacterium]|nr:antibiotic biosynthesis monooxygenase [Hyphomicrobiales bacterium]MCP5372456.1 antibiotic biosynthesis monooxygenase [Hyphomicrobiales bacterium]
MVHVVAVITAKPGQRAAVLAAFNANVSAVRAEDGCIEYGAAVDSPEAGGWAAKYGEDSFVVIEKWASMAALGAHAKSAHMAAYAAQTKDMLADRQVYVLTSA